MSKIKKSDSMDRGRPEKIAAMLASGKTYREIGEHFGISRQRAHQLAAIHAPDEASRRSEETLRKPKGKCGVCGKPMYSPTKSCSPDCSRIIYAMKRHDRFVKCVNARRSGLKWKEIATEVGFKTATGAYNFTAMEFRFRELPADMTEKFFSSTPPSQIKDWLSTEIDENFWSLCLKHPRPIVEDNS